MNGDAKMIAQELDVSFIGSGGNVIAEEFIDYQEKNNVRDQYSPKVRTRNLDLGNTRRRSPIRYGCRRF
jgi:hypothetical protein